MAVFIMALSINPNAKKLHSDLNARINDSLEVFHRNNVKISQLYATLGRYDYLAIFDAPDQTSAFKIASEINIMGILETETWPVIPYDDYTKLFR
jgi:uncharacterized protein with GYD domain